MKLFKKPLFTFILGALIFTGVGVYASEALRAQDILYSNSKDTNITSVKDALDKLYTEGGAKKFCELKSGTALTIGSKYECDPGDGVKRNFYILAIEPYTVRMIMEDNISTSTMAWDVAQNYFTTGEGAIYTSTWTNVGKIEIPSPIDLAALVGRNWSRGQDITSISTMTWLLSGDDYWTSWSYSANYATDSNKIAWYVGTSGKQISYTMNGRLKVRPVITVLKDNLD